MERWWTDEFLTAALWIEPLKGAWDHFYTVSQQNQVKHKHFHFLSCKFLVRVWACHRTTTISLSLRFPPRTLLGLCWMITCRASWREENQYRIDSSYRSYQDLSCRVIFFSRYVFIGTAPYCLSASTTNLWLRADQLKYSQWFVKGIFIWKTNGPMLKGNESLSEQPLCPVLKYLLKPTCNQICAQMDQAFRGIPLWVRLALLLL